MQQRRKLSQKQINQELLSGNLKTPKWYIPTMLFLGFFVVTGFAVILYMFNTGLGVTGLSRPVYWGLFITTFVFWVGISHAGIMISAILRLTQAEWRRPVTRAAELLTVFSLLTALFFPLMHAGRPWRIVYWLMPYDFARGIWPNIRSPLFWDPIALGNYLTGSTLFLYVALIPDLAVLRDRTTGWQKVIYTILALGWRGNPRQWLLQTVAGILLSALMLPIFVSVHSIVSWDFAITPSVEGWHEGVEWIDSGTLIERVNFASSEISNLEKPGVRKLISRVKSDISTSTSNKEILDKCSEIIGCNLSDNTRGFLLDSIDNSPNNNQKIDEHIGQVLGFIAATKEYQLV